MPVQTNAARLREPPAGAGRESDGVLGTAEFAPSVPDALLFGLLWVGGAVFVAPYLLRMTGGGA
ncbi:hypothetical protein EAO76_27380, partial [Streptomyces sp. sk2.1]